MASTYLTRTSGTPTSQKKGTFSFWVKRSGLGSTTRLFNNHVTSVHYGYIDFTGSDKLRVAGDDAGTISIQTNRVFRDVNSWYHIVIAIDTTQSTASDRIKIYVNGVQETSMAVTTYPPQNDNLNFFNASASNGHVIGSYYNGSAYSGGFNGSISHFHFIDGTAYDATAFGETDSTTGEWKAKTSPSVTYGTNGFFILKDGNGITDQSGEGNDFTLGGGTLTNLKDNPDNTFATMNSLNKTSNILLGNGNLNVGTTNTGTDEAVVGTIAFGNGKYYSEFKRESAGQPAFGIVRTSSDGTTHSRIEADRIMYHSNGNIYTNGLGITNINTGVTYASGDIISMSFDTENGIIKWYKNDTLVTNSTITNSQLEFANDEWIPMIYCANGNGSFSGSANFGNGYFGTTAVSSAGTNASDNGIFEYDVPTGYTALSTKGLNL